MRDSSETSRDHTGIIPGAEEARGVAVYARVASADRAGRAIGVTRPAYTRGLPITACMHRSTSAVSTSIRAFDVTALGPLSADVFECGVAITRDVITSIHPVVGIHACRKKCSLGRVPPTDGGLVPSQTYKDLVECADDTAVLTEIESDTAGFPIMAGSELGEKHRRMTVLKRPIVSFCCRQRAPR